MARVIASIGSDLNSLWDNEEFLRAHPRRGLFVMSSIPQKDIIEIFTWHKGSTLQPIKWMIEGDQPLTWLMEEQYQGIRDWVGALFQKKTWDPRYQISLTLMVDTWPNVSVGFGNKDRFGSAVFEPHEIPLTNLLDFVNECDEWLKPRGLTSG